MPRRLAFSGSLLLVVLFGCKGIDRNVIALNQEDLASSVSPDLAGVDSDLGQQPPGTWTLEPSGTTTNLYGVWGASNTDVFAVGGTPGLDTGNSGVTAHFDGSGWSSAVNNIDLLSISGVGVGSATAVGEFGYEGQAIYLHTNAWSANELLSGYTLRGTWQTSPGAYAVGDNGVLMYTTENGVAGSWGVQVSNTTNALNAVWGSSTSNVYVVGAGGIILHATNAGVGTTPTWVKTVQGSGGFKLFGVWGSSDADVYVVGYAPTDAQTAVILHSIDGGQSWTITAGQFPNVMSLFAVGGRSANDVYAVGATGKIVHSSGGDIWTVEPSPTTSDLYGVWVASNGEAFAIGGGGTILHRH